ncbi:hypothetical protein BKA61DRAFT_697479 [Leptodontidium sp. MPI-SDFR-AT-0119]|nr:hypothetical protein BKA61DRAFT_697479 [Leptodontidium sp. MPI-SDFR-AT-0119]
MSRAAFSTLSNPESKQHYIQKAAITSFIKDIFIAPATAVQLKSRSSSYQSQRPSTLREQQVQDGIRNTPQVQELLVANAAEYLNSRFDASSNADSNICHHTHFIANYPDHFHVYIKDFSLAHSTNNAKPHPGAIQTYRHLPEMWCERVSGRLYSMWIQLRARIVGRLVELRKMNPRGVKRAEWGGTCEVDRCLYGLEAFS